MRNLIPKVLVLLLLTATGCGGGGDSSDGAGGENAGGAGVGIPIDISGTYSLRWSGGGTNAMGAFTCSGTSTMTLTQSGTVLTARLILQSETGDCEDWFDLSMGGTYASSTGEINMSTEIGANTVIVTGTASQAVDGTVTLSGQWTVIDTASADVVASGDWSAQPM